MTSLIFFVCQTSAFTIAAIALIFLWLFRNRLPRAYPNHRSLHSSPIPCVAGLAIWAGLCFAVLLGLGLTGESPLAYDARWMTFAAGWAILAAVSLRDDLHGVSIFYRLVVQTIAAIMMTTTWVTIEPSFQKLSFNILDLFFVPRELAVISVVVFIVWMVNLFNFMDGSDGLATTMAVIGFTTLSIAAHWMSFAWWWLPALVAGACLPVYFVNFPPARMFIGDVGAVPLGFLVAGFGGLGIVQHGWPVGFLVLVFLPFILDATVTLSWRVLRGERFWEAHKTHYFQRLVQMGLGHRGVLAVYTTLMIGCSVTALWTYHYHKGLYVALGFWIVVHAVLFLVVDVKTVRESSNS